MKKCVVNQAKNSFVSSDASIREIIRKYPETIPVFLNYGLHCAGCPMTEPETLDDIARLHNIKVDKLIADLKKTIKKKVL